MKKEPGAARPKRPASRPKAPPPTPDAVTASLSKLMPPGERPALWKEAKLQRRLHAPERPLLAAALQRLEEERQVLVLPLGKMRLYLFAEPLRGWLTGSAAGTAAVPDLPEPASPRGTPEDLFAVYERLVRRSGGFPDVKLADLRAALVPAAAGTLSEQVLTLWRAGRATLSQGDWSLADEATRHAAVELFGERYLLVRLEG